MEGFGRGMRSQRGRGAEEENWRSPRKEAGFEMGFSPGGFSPGGRRGGGWAPGMSPKQKAFPQGSPRRPEENWRDRERPPEMNQNRSKRRHPSDEKHGGRGSGIHGHRDCVSHAYNDIHTHVCVSSLAHSINVIIPFCTQLLVRY